MCGGIVSGSGMGIGGGGGSCSGVWGWLGTRRLVVVVVVAVVVSSAVALVLCVCNGMVSGDEIAKFRAISIHLRGGYSSVAKFSLHVGYSASLAPWLFRGMRHQMLESEGFGF